jgi:branched-chain amino acid transport system permease protein
MKKLFPKRLTILVLVLLLLLCPLFLDVYLIYILNLIGIAIVLAVGLNLVMGYAGQISLGHAAFYGTGAYTTALLMAKLSWPFWIALPLGGMVATTFGFLIGIPALRLSGPYLALVTLSFGEIFQLIITHWYKLTEGPLGLVVPAAKLGPVVFDKDKKLFYLVLVICILLIILAYNVVKSKAGRAFVALRESEIAAQSIGINLTKYKLIAFALSAFYGGIAGGLYACVGHLVDPLDFGLFQSISYLSMIIIGGLSSVTGSIIGAIIIVVLQQLLGRLHSYQELVYGVLLLLILIFMPRGIQGKLSGIIKVRRD